MLHQKYILSALLIVLVALSKATFSVPTGMYLKINTDLPLIVTVESSTCTKAANEININTLVYLESPTDQKSCSINFSLSDSNKIKIASYELIINLDSSSAKNTFILPPNIQNVNLYPYAMKLDTLLGKSKADFTLISISAKDLSQWMNLINDKMQKPLNKLYITGTHDSGTYAIKNSSAYSPDSYNVWKNMGGDTASQFNANWGHTQDSSIKEQLESGIRYFDLRLCADGVEVDDISTCHSQYGETLKNVVSSVKEFLQQKNHQNEIIILDINHWYNQHNKNLVSMKKNALDYVNQELIPWIAPRRDANGQDLYTPSTAMSSFLAKKVQVIIASTSIPENTDKNYNFVWHSINTQNLNECIELTDICSYWPNAQDVAKLQASVTGTLNTLSSTPHNYLFILQTQLTPSASMVVKGMAKSSSFQSLKSLTGSYKDSMTTFLQRPEIYNDVAGIIFIEDFSNGIDQTNLVMQLNSR